MSSSSDPPGPRFLTLPQVGDELTFSQSQVSALVRSGDLVGIQIGGPPAGGVVWRCLCTPTGR